MLKSDYGLRPEFLEGVYGQKEIDEEWIDKMVAYMKKIGSHNPKGDVCLCPPKLIPSEKIQKYGRENGVIFKLAEGFMHV